MGSGADRHLRGKGLPPQLRHPLLARPTTVARPFLTQLATQNTHATIAITNDAASETVPTAIDP